MIKDNCVNWSEQFKIRICNADTSRQKHEVIKLLLMMKIIEKHKKDKKFLRLYSEFSLENSGLIPDLYYENLKDKSVICYEIQKEMTPAWLSDRIRRYELYEVPYFTVNFIPIPLRELSDNIIELNTELDKYIF